MIQPWVRGNNSAKLQIIYVFLMAGAQKIPPVKNCGGIL